MSWLSWIYAVALILMAAYGCNMLLYALVALVLQLRPAAEAPAGSPSGDPSDWPVVLVQLPLYNGLIDAVISLEYVPGRLIFQVLDDSTDDTTAIARARVAYHRARGHAITLLHRSDRSGFKAGALAAGLAAAPAGDLVAIFDADFVPARDFLWRTVPPFAADPRLALVQGRWDHLNPDEGVLTRSEALQLDAYFGVDQVVRSRLGLLMNFNGSAGVWRRAAIEAGGGWQGDTLAEDLDLSYRVQLKGWRMTYLRDVAAPAELPNSILAFKRQQSRWSKGSFQVALKLVPQLLRARMPLFRKLQGWLHLTGYLPHPLMVLTVLLSLPIVLWQHGQMPIHMGIIGVASFGPPAVGILGQLILRPDWRRRLVYYPLLVLLGIGLSFNNTVAACEAFFGRTSEFKRTPKGGGRYTLSIDWTTWAEAFLAFYALVSGLLARQLAPGLATFLLLYAASFAYIAALGFYQADPVRQRESSMAQAASTAQDG